MRLYLAILMIIATSVGAWAQDVVVDQELIWGRSSGRFVESPTQAAEKAKKFIKSLLPENTADPTANQTPADPQISN